MSASGATAKLRAQFLATIAGVLALPVLGRLPVAAIDTGLVLRCIEPIWQSKTETASRVRGRIEAILDWATVRGYRAGDNPARWKGHLSAAVLPARGQIAKVQHHRALPFAEVPGFMVQLAAREGMGARALEFLVLTAARTGEVIHARWSEIDLDRMLWTVPAERMKEVPTSTVCRSPTAQSRSCERCRARRISCSPASAGAPRSPARR